MIIGFFWILVLLIKPIFNNIFYAVSELYFTYKSNLAIITSLTSTNYFNLLDIHCNRQSLFQLRTFMNHN